MSDAELQAIRKRCEEATLGPWEVGWRTRNHGSNSIVNADGDAIAKMIPLDNPWEEDAVFIAHARNDVPALLAEIDLLHIDIHGAWCWLSEALGTDTYAGPEPTPEALRLSAETLAKRVTALADHLEGKPSDIDLGVYDNAGGSFGRLLVAARRLLAAIRARKT